MAVELDVRVIPRAARDQLAGTRDGRLLVRVTAPPLDGRANAAVCALLAKAAGVPKGAVSVVRGETSRDKRVQIEADVDARDVRRALGLL
ncbi:MAG TPA: DUF167 domain-containing protein [Conexibacter sp.]|nr:DUF167 domain-containing protein [Conexibacter sp.]